MGEPHARRGWRARTRSSRIANVRQKETREIKTMPMRGEDDPRLLSGGAWTYILRGTGASAKALAKRAAVEGKLERLFICNEKGENDARTKYIDRAEKSQVMYYAKPKGKTPEGG
jgi:hypothetical protein